MGTNELKKVYEDADKSAFFFEQPTPVDLFRRRNAPKDDMPLALFLQHLKGFEAKLKKQGTG